MTDDIDTRLEALERRLTAIEERIGSGLTPRLPKTLSIGEILRAAKPRTDVEKVLVIGYYMEKFGGRQNFTVKELSEQFLQAKEPQPSNINQCVNQNIQKGLLMQWPTKRDGQKCWGVTSSGDVEVAKMMRNSSEHSESAAPHPEPPPA